MASCYAQALTMTNPITLLLPRDLNILAALDRTPLTIEQLLKLSRTFAVPFTSASRVRGRLQKLREAGWVRRWRYAAATRGTPTDYYTLSPEGFHLLHGHTVPFPHKRHFSEVGIARQHHTRSLADVVVHLTVTAHEHGVRLIDFTRENSLRLSVGEASVYPDCAFQLETPSRDTFNFVVELDCGSERIRSTKEVDSLERKIRLYDQFQDTCPNRFRVLFVTTRSVERLDHILAAAGTLVRNPRRSLVYGATLAELLAHSDPILAPCFRDHRKQALALIPPLLRRKGTEPFRTGSLDQLVTA